MNIHIQAHNHLLSEQERPTIEQKLQKLEKFTHKHLEVDLNVLPMDGKVDENCVQVRLLVRIDGKEFFNESKGTNVVKVAERSINHIFREISKWKDKKLTSQRRA